MNIAQLSEQLKDVPQGTLVGYAKNPNSVVPQFLALAEIQRRQHLQAQPAAPTGTVAEDVLAQAQPAPQMMQPQMAQMAQQLPENQPGVAQLPTGMPQGMASGGIVAFASGDLVDDEEDDREMAQLFPTSRLAGFSDLLASIPSSVRALADKLPKSYEATKKESSTPLEGIDALLAKARQLESGGRHFDERGNIITSPKGAEGIMQVMRHTQRDPGFGVTPAKDKSPSELQRVGEDYFKAMLAEFKDPQIAAMAYNWGPGNVKKWLESGKTIPVPKETLQYRSHFAKGGVASFAGPAGSLVGPAGEPISDFLERNPVEPTPEKKLSRLEAARAREVADAERALIENRAKAAAMRGAPVSAASAAAPAAEVSTLGRLNKLIGGFIAPAAVYEGGKYATAGGLSTLTPQEYSATRDILTGAGGGDDTALAAAIMNEADYSKAPSAWSEGLKKLFSSTPPASKPAAPSPTPAAVPAAPQAKAAEPVVPAAEEPKSNQIKPYGAPDVVAPKTKADLYAEALEKDIAVQANKAKEAGDMNLYLALMQAGLGMMASKSPYALSGIGEGGQAGISTYAALQKQQADREKDIMGTRLGLYKYGASAEAAAANRALEREYKDLALAQRGDISKAELDVRRSEAAQRQITQAQTELRRFEDQQMENLKARFPVPLPKDPAYQAALKAIYDNPIYKELYSIGFPSLAKQQATPTGTVKQYNPKTNKVE